jgi:hypothetical protein
MVKKPKFNLDKFFADYSGISIESRLFSFRLVYSELKVNIDGYTRLFSRNMFKPFNTTTYKAKQRLTEDIDLIVSLSMNSDYIIIKVMQGAEILLDYRNYKIKKGIKLNG